ncbi:oxidoreductase short chain dehydrogenase/reductase family protein [Anaeramoeba flamelloides]|uniref:Oxidoreductase short chain dehydrogenase/reductase family protein n=1 Tax=Anaeramoeba flamelloides TaxID=1746091 RepID=A0AAV7ZBL6_9EUKA|nr:oxidoreductase short chain dehydrogenase/reductase family protein [Anaeramoeba flamelloides]
MLLMVGLNFYPTIYLHFQKEIQNVKKLYNVEWALVTGSSTGIGKEMAKILVAQGVNVVLLSSNEERLEQCKNDLLKINTDVEIKIVALDLTKAFDHVQKTVAESTKDLPISLVINNAGYALSGKFQDLTSETLSSHINCNVSSHVAITHHFYKMWTEKKVKGYFVFTASIVGYLPFPNLNEAYSGAKGYLRMFSNTMSAKSKKDGISCLVMHPGPVHNSRFLNKSGHFNDETPAKFTFSQTADVVAKHTINAIGKFTSVESGWYATLVKLIKNVSGLNFVSLALKLTPDIFTAPKAISKKNN